MISLLITFFKGFILILSTVIVYFALVELGIITANYIKLRTPFYLQPYNSKQFLF